MDNSEKLSLFKKNTSLSFGFSDIHVSNDSLLENINDSIFQGGMSRKPITPFPFVLKQHQTVIDACWADTADYCDTKIGNNVNHRDECNLQIYYHPTSDTCSSDTTHHG
jgi:hypothetical protein